MQTSPIILSIGVDFARAEAAFVSTMGGVIHRQAEEIVRTVSGKSAHVDPAHLVNAAVRAVRTLVELKPREARHVAGVSLIGRSPTAVYVTSRGARTPFLLPGDETVERARAALTLDESYLYAKVALPLARCDVPYALAASGKPPQDAFICMPKDYVRWVLTGEFATDALDAQRTFLWDLQARKWSDELCSVFRIPARALPRILPPAQIAGTITAEAAEMTGLKKGTPVACGLGDWGEYLGSGACEVGDAFEHIGTTGAFFGVTDARPAAKTTLEVRPHFDGSKFLAGRQALPGGLCLEWFLSNTHLARTSGIDWRAADLELEAAAAMGHPENVLFLPNLSGGEAQVADAAFLNMGLGDDTTSLLQSVMEGLFFSLKSVADEVKAAGWKGRAVYATGQVGFKHAPRKMRAHIYGLPIFGGKTPGANVTAAAIVGAVTAGLYGDIRQAREKMLNLDGGVMNDPSATRHYDAHYATWVGARNFLAPRRAS